MFSFVQPGAVPIPTHYYMVGSRCDDTQCGEETSMFAVILPHREQPDNCWVRINIAWCVYRPDIAP